MGIYIISMYDVVPSVCTRLNSVMPTPKAVNTSDHDNPCVSSCINYRLDEHEKGVSVLVPTRKAPKKLLYYSSKTPATKDARILKVTQIN